MPRKLLFVIGLIFAATPRASPPIALGLGLACSILFAQPFQHAAQKVSKVLLQACVVGLGFSMNLHEVLKVGRSGILYTVVGISFVMVLGIALARMLKVESNNGLLISVGTAVCGGSAIAAVGPAVEATDEEMSISLGTVYILNSVALIVFPIVGRKMALTQEQFGLWAALAIHDTSSVVGAGIKYGAAALTIATTVKLARALWIAPVTLVAAIGKRRQARIKWPWFIVLFVVATIMNTYVRPGAALFSMTGTLAKAGLVVALYLIGSSISRATLKTVGARPLLHGAVLWLVVAGISLALIYARIIAL